MPVLRLFLMTVFTMALGATVANASTGFPPFQLAYGRIPSATPTIFPLTEPGPGIDLAKSIVENLKLAAARVLSAQDAQADHANRTRRAATAYKPGDMVYLATNNLTMLRR
ncbi:hypothetical protein HK105_209508 [Polyrhizophydium stewartii]|uniref:Uncharacterized protein n=1 Tax=Polyrhizophydium stewartii TaxID=2732419 RepID=A0ABR4MUU8_9FUNG